MGFVKILRDFDFIDRARRDAVSHWSKVPAMPLGCAHGTEEGVKHLISPLPARAVEEEFQLMPTFRTSSRLIAAQ
jgi:hypothetical protein